LELLRSVFGGSEFMILPPAVALPMSAVSLQSTWHGKRIALFAMAPFSADLVGRTNRRSVASISQMNRYYVLSLSGVEWFGSDEIRLVNSGELPIRMAIAVLPDYMKIAHSQDRK
jgi:hypothetical protein